MQWIDRKLQISFLHTHYVNSSFIFTYADYVWALTRPGPGPAELGRKWGGGQVPFTYFCSHMKRAATDDYYATQILEPSASHVEQQYTPHCLGHLVLVRSLPTIHIFHQSLEQMHWFETIFEIQGRASFEAIEVKGQFWGCNLEIL